MYIMGRKVHEETAEAHTAHVGINAGGAGRRGVLKVGLWAVDEVISPGR